MEQDNLLKNIGLVIIIVSAIVLFSATPLAQQAVVKIGILEITDVSPIHATKVAIGAVGIVLGLVVYFGKDGLKIFVGR